MASRFDEAKQAVVVEMLRAGFRRSQAAMKAGVTPQTVRLLVRAGLDANGEPMAGSFAEAVADAEDEAVGQVENQLFAAAQSGMPWAVQLYLKGKARDEYGDKPPVTNINNNTIQVEGSADDRRKVIAALSAELDARKAITAGDAE